MQQLQSTCIFAYLRFFMILLGFFRFVHKRSLPKPITEFPQGVLYNRSSVLLHIGLGDWSPAVGYQPAFMVHISCIMICLICTTAISVITCSYLLVMMLDWMGMIYCRCDHCEPSTSIMDEQINAFHKYVFLYRLTTP